MQLLRRSDSNSRPKVRPVVGVHDHRVSKKQTNEGVNNVRTVTSSLHSNEGITYAVDTLEVRNKISRFATFNGNAKSVRAFPGVTESTV